MVNQALESVECPVLNEAWIRDAQSAIRVIGGNIAEVRSPGLKVQISIVELSRMGNVIYCEHCRTNNPDCPGMNYCELKYTYCIYDSKRKNDK